MVRYREKWEKFNGKIPNDLEIDHKDRDRSNNEISNMRLATRTQNQCNRGVPRFNKKSSQYKGVCFINQVELWEAYIQINYKFKHLGFFTNENAAALCYNENVEFYHGEFAVKNKVLSNIKDFTKYQKLFDKNKTTSKYKGVTLKRVLKNGNKRWTAFIKIKGINKNLGYFKNEDEAALVYNCYAYLHLGKNTQFNTQGLN